MKVARLALLLALGFAPFASAFEFGVCVHLAMAKSDAATVTRLMDEGGFNSLRDDAFWSGVEKTAGVLEYPARYAESRSAMQSVAKRGGQPIVILAYGNNLYDGGGFPVSPEGIAAYANYSGFVVRTLRDSVRNFEVWNEWNSGFGSKPKARSGSAADYVKLLAAASKSIRAANPEARVIGGVTAGVDLKWLRDLIAAGGLEHLDAISVHSYTLFRRHTNPEGAVRSLDKLHDLLEAAAPGRHIPIYVTEIGWPTSRGGRGASEGDVAKYLVRFTMLARSRPFVAGVWWYDLIDDGDADDNPQHRFGLVRGGSEPKAAFAAARAISPLVTGDASVRAYQLDPSHFVTTGKDDSGRWAIAWTLEEKFRDWSDGVPALTEAPPEFAALVAELPADGQPVMFRPSGGGWRADAGWRKKLGSAPVPDVPRVSREGAP